MPQESKIAPMSLIRDFRSRWLETAGEYQDMTARMNLSEEICRFLEENGIKSVVIGGPPLTAELGRLLTGRVEILADFWRDSFDPRQAVELCGRAEAGITGVDGLIAETGTLAIASRGQGDRLVSILPPVHLAVATETPVFQNMETFVRMAPNTLTYCFITGPSRTADIEKQLVHGVHGPVRVALWGPAV